MSVCANAAILIHSQKALVAAVELPMRELILSAVLTADERLKQVS
jgi:hypothetical protein